MLSKPSVQRNINKLTYIEDVIENENLDLVDTINHDCKKIVLNQAKNSFG